MEFIVTGIENFPQTIDSNFEDVRNWLNEQLNHYNTLVVTEDSIKAAKEDRARLNKLKKAIDERRKEIKAKIMTPYEKIETDMKKLIAIIDLPIASIDRQIKAFDEQKQAEKFEILKAHYNEIIGDFAKCFPIERILNPKWRNIGESVEKLNAEMTDTINRIKADWVVIRENCGEYVTACKKKYVETMSLSEALAERNKLQSIAQTATEPPQAQENDITINIPPQAETSVQQPQRTAQAAIEKGIVKDIDVRFYATTPEFRAAMRELTQKYNIRYGNVPKN